MSTVMQNTEESYRAAMANAMRRFCDDLENLSNVVTLFSKDTRIQKVTYMQGNQIDYARVNVTELHNFSRELIFHCTNNRLYSNAAICFPTKSAVISTRGLWNLDWFLEDEFHISSMQYQDWLDLFNDKATRHLIPDANKTSFGYESDGIAYVYIGERDMNGDALMSVLFWIDSQGLDGYLSDLVLFPGTVAVLSGSDGRFAHGYAPCMGEGMARAFWAKASDEDRFTAEDGERYRVMRYPSLQSDWHYTVWLPEREIYAEAYQIQRTMYIIAAVMLLIGVAVSFELALINYRPLERVFSALSALVTGSSANADGHQLARTEQQLHQMIRQYAHWHDQTASNRLMLQRAALTHMLHGDPDFQSAGSEGVLAMLDMPMSGAQFSVCVLLDGDDADAELCCANWDLRAGRCYAVHQCSPATIIVNHDTEDLRPVMAHMPSAVGLCFSTPKGSVAELPTALQEALAARMHCPVQTDGAVFFGTLSIDEHIAVLTAQQERQLTGVLADGSPERAVALLDQMIERGPQPMTRFIASKWVAAIEDAMLRADDPQGCLVERLRELRASYSDDPADQLNHARAMVAEAAKLQGEQLSRQKSAFQVALIEYIDAHLCDAQLSLGSVAEAMNVTPAHLSRAFKDQMGVGYLEYVNEKRIARAKVLIQEHGLSVGEAAARMGFTSDATFRRLFKKYTGFAPSKLDRVATPSDPS